MIGIIGGGVWGSALAKLFSSEEVLIYARDTKIKDSINEHHFNPHLKYAVFNDDVKARLRQLADETLKLASKVS